MKALLTELGSLRSTVWYTMKLIFVFWLVLPFLASNITGIVGLTIFLIVTGILCWKVKAVKAFLIFLFVRSIGNSAGRAEAEIAGRIKVHRPTMRKAERLKGAKSFIFCIKLVIMGTGVIATALAFFLF